MKKIMLILITLAVTETLLTCCSNTLKEVDLIGKTFNYKIAPYQYITFSTSTYEICEKNNENVKVGTCYGTGKWSIKDGKIIIGTNNSISEKTRQIEGTHEFNEFREIN